MAARAAHHRRAATPRWTTTARSAATRPTNPPPIPEAWLAREGNGVAAELSYAGHLLMENRNALIADMELSSATGYAEREMAPTLLWRLPTRARRRTVGGDKGYDATGFIAGCRELGITPHVSQTAATGAAPSTGAPPGGDIRQSASS